MTPDIQRILPYIIGGTIFLVLMVFRIRGMSRSTRLRLEWLWVTPAILAAIAALSMLAQPPAGMDWAWLALALVLGAAPGWYRGKMMHITVDPETHALNTKASPAAIIFIVVILLARYGLRYLAMTQAQAWHVSATVITDALIVFAVGLFGMQRVEMWIRANRLLGEARAARAAGAAAS